MRKLEISTEKSKELLKNNKVELDYVLEKLTEEEFVNVYSNSKFICKGIVCKNPENNKFILFKWMKK